MLQSRGQVDTQQLVGTFFKASRRHDGKVNGSAQVDQIGVGRVLDLDLFVGFVVFVFATADIRIVSIVLVASISLSEDFSPELLVSLLVGFPVGVEFEDVEAILNLDLVVQSGVVGNLILLFDKIQLFLDRGVILVAILSDLEQNFNHVLGSLIDVGFVQDTTELVVDGHGDLRIELLDVLADLPHQTDGNLDAVVSGLVQQKQQDLSGKHLVSDLLVDQVGQEGGAAQADSLVVTLEGLAELYDQAVDQQLADLRKFGVDNGDHGGVDGSKWQTGSLSLHDASAEETTATDEVLAEQLGDNVFDVGDIDLVDQTVDGLFQSLPGHALELGGLGIVADLGLESAQPGWRDICSSRAHGEQTRIFSLCSGLLVGS
jgi:hypothetical protein